MSETECCSIMGNTLALCSGGYEILLGNAAGTFTDIFISWFTHVPHNNVAVTKLSYHLVLYNQCCS